MEIRYEITEADYINFNLYHIENSPSQKKVFNLLRFILPLIFAITIYYMGTGLFKQPSTYWIIIAVLFTALWIIYYPRQHKKTIKKQTKKLLSEGDNSSIFGEKIMSVEENSIKILDEFSSEIILKDNIKDVKVYDDMMVIYLSSITAHIVPTRYLNYESKEFLINYFGL